MKKYTISNVISSFSVKPNGSIDDELCSTYLNIQVQFLEQKSWAIYLGWSLGNLISNTGKIDEELLKVIAYGESSASYTKYIKNNLTYDTSSYYERNDDVVYGLQILGQLRIVGEDKYAEIANQRSVIRKWIGKLLGCSQGDIEEFCSENIDEVIRRCGNCDILVNRKFDGSYLN